MNVYLHPTPDYQEISIQGQVAFRVERPENLAKIMNFALGKDGQSYRSEDPKKLDDRVVRTVQVVIQMAVEQVSLREALHLSQLLVSQIKAALAEGMPGQRSRHQVHHADRQNNRLDRLRLHRLV